MNWNEIEFKWAAMARRVRADLPDWPRDNPEKDPPTQQPGDLPQPPPVSSKVSVE